MGETTANIMSLNHRVVKMKHLIYTLLIFSFEEVIAQNVSIRKGNFKIGNEIFYPICMNYETELFFDGTNFIVSPSANYGPNSPSDRDCNNEKSCLTQMQNDFNYLSSIGFNCVRIPFAPDFAVGVGLQAKYTQWMPTPSYLSIDPTNSTDPGMLAMFNFYDKILQLASSTTPRPLKVIFLVVHHNIDPNDDNKVIKHWDSASITARNNYLDELSKYINLNKNREALFAYDLYNEPCYFLERIPKNEASSLITNWYDIIKSNDPDRLITIGSCGMQDVFSFDPSVLKVDFFSYHIYPDFQSYEDRTSPLVQQRVQKRLANELYWCNKVSEVPWMIGETGYSSGLPPEKGMHGSLQQMGDYVNFSLNAVCNCNGKGYSWWKFQESSWAPATEPENFLGLLYKDHFPGTSAEKQPAVDIFKKYLPIKNDVCPVDYNSTYDMNKIYYNKYSYPAFPAAEISSTLIDEKGDPIQDAVIDVLFQCGGTSPIDSIQLDRFYTISDQNGYFKAFPYFGGTVNPTNVYLSELLVTSPGGESLRFTNNGDPVILPSSIILNRTNKAN